MSDPPIISFIFIKLALYGTGNFENCIVDCLIVTLSFNCQPGLRQSQMNFDRWL